jgi:hypothetical protein
VSERFTNVVESQVPDWRVDNLGMTGFGPGLMLRAFEAVGLDAEPDVVVVTMYTDDFRRVRPHYAGVGFQVPRFELKQDSLVDVAYPTPKPWSGLRLFQGLRHLYWARTDAELELNGAILDRFVRHATERGFELVLLFVPGRADTRTDRGRRRWLREYAGRADTPFLDLTGAIHSVPRDELFIPSNPHLNPAGHRIIADELIRFLDERGIARTP